MKNGSKKYPLVFVFLCLAAGLFANDHTALLHRAQKAITTVIVHDIFSPPVASRIYLYASLAAHECLTVSGSVKSFHAVHNDYTQPDPLPFRGRVDEHVAAVYAMMITASTMVFSDTALLDSLSVIMTDFKGLDSSTIRASMEWGTLVSNAVVAWSKTDRYAETRKLRRYTLIKDKSAWAPTPPGYFAPVEPHWGKLRTVALDSLAVYRPKTSIPFSDSVHSPFYKQAEQVFRHTRSMSTSDSAIALFWDCNPFHLTVQGHLNFATKKLSPGGHWMSIAGIAAQQMNASLAKTVQAYLYTSIALYDAFISCWDEKYRSNVIRPETYINAYMDESWRPLLQTPPFPEYTSGHSVISSASAVVLTALFGPEFKFVDDTEVPYGLPVREFASFWDAAKEAAISRFYGGIHYMSAIENGLQQGEKIGKKVTAVVQEKLSMSSTAIRSFD
jgi:hypothetical protein